MKLIGDRGDRVKKGPYVYKNFQRFIVYPITAVKIMNFFFFFETYSTFALLIYISQQLRLLYFLSKEKEIQKN